MAGELTRAQRLLLEALAKEPMNVWQLAAALNTTVSAVSRVSQMLCWRGPRKDPLVTWDRYGDRREITAAGRRALGEG